MESRFPTAMDGDTKTFALFFPSRFPTPRSLFFSFKDHFVEEGTQGLYYCQLEPMNDEVLHGTDLVELEELHSRAKALSNGFLGPFKVCVCLCVISSVVLSLPSSVERRFSFMSFDLLI